MCAPTTNWRFATAALRGTGDHEMHSWTPPVIALTFGAAIVGFALFGRNTYGKDAAPQAPVVLAEPESPPLPEPARETEEAAPEPAEVAPSTPPAPGYDTLPDGTPVPELPKGTPASVRFGVILFEYEGAQGAPGQSSSSSRPRSKEAARALARQTLELARTDFAKAVEKGDRGSAANAGSIPRGVLEPSVEYLLFTLEKGTIHPEPIDTPRGYWIVRRIQ